MLNGLTLEIDDFGVINHANIEFGNITVVGGVNASGKSTASKLLYCFLKAMSLNRNEYILRKIVPEINSFINTIESPRDADHKIPDKFTVDDNLEDILRGYEMARNKLAHLSEDFVIPEEFIYEQKIFKIDKYIPILKGNKEENYSSVVKSLFESESLLTFNGKSTFHNDSFRSNVSCENTEIPYDTLFDRGYDLRDKKISFDDFDRNFVYSSEGNFDWLNDVFFIDSISLFDLSIYLNDFLQDDDEIEYKEHVIQLLANLSVEWDVDAETEEKIKSIEKIFKKLLKSFDLGRDEIIKNLKSYYGDHSFIYYAHQINANISSGVQQIEIVERLLNSKKLIPGTFLIIDEPEVNLHPEWQFKFAEILVLLAKELDVPIYLNSHSPMFIESINAFSEYYDMQDDVNYYLTEESEVEGRYNFTKVPANKLYKIYNNLGNVYDLIDKLRLEKHLGE